MKRSLILEWLLMSLTLLALVFWLSGPQHFPRANLWLKDLALGLHSPPASPEIVLIAIDERSLASIGRWPWRRALHAHLIHYINQGKPSSIGLDILFAEPELDYPEDDILLEQSIRHSGRVVLPLVSGDSAQSTSLPLPLFAQAAASLGHVNLPLDPDGGVRSFYAQEGTQNHMWLHLGLSVLCLKQPQTPHCSTAAPPTSTPNSTTDPWLRSDLMRIAFAAGETPFTTYSYIDVLRGLIPPSSFRNKHVLIGTTATGLGTTALSPSGASPSALHNVELLAHIVNGELQHQHVTAAPAWANYLFNVLPVALGLAALSVLGPSTALLTCLGLILLTLLVHMLTPTLTHIVFRPSAALLGLAIAYPLWSWRRLSVAAQFLNQEMQDLRIQGLNTHAPSATRRGDFLQNRILAVEHATQQLRQLHQFVTDTLLQLPSPTMVCNRMGQIVLANSAAHRYAQLLERPLQELQPIADLLEGAIERGNLQALWSREHPPPLDQTVQREGIDFQQRSLLMLSKPFTVAKETGWLVSLVDISELRAAMAQRDQALNFISHDIRSPLGAILTVIEMEQHYGTSAQISPELLERIQRYARHGLALADDFVHLARAQNTSTPHVPVELGSVIDQALDDTWATAHAREITLQWSPQEQEAWVLGNASMLRRACVNLLSNAIKYGPSGGTVHCSLRAENNLWCITVRDEGEGISPEEQARLFAPFARQTQHTNSSIPGIGLGLAYVHTAALQHGGHIEVHSELGQGSSFTLYLPQAAINKPH